jgi:hypothetical protein
MRSVEVAASLSGMAVVACSAMLLIVASVNGVVAEVEVLLAVAEEERKREVGEKRWASGHRATWNLAANMCKSEVKSAHGFLPVYYHWYKHIMVIIASDAIHIIQFDLYLFLFIHHLPFQIIHQQLNGNDCINN